MAYKRKKRAKRFVIAYSKGNGRKARLYMHELADTSFQSD